MASKTGDGWTATNLMDVSMVQIAPTTYNSFVGDIAGSITDDEVRNAFAQCGPISQIRVIRDRATGESKGYGFVHFGTKDALQNAIDSSANGIIKIQGRVPRVKLADQKLVLFVGNLPNALTKEQAEEALCSLIDPLLDRSNYTVDVKDREGLCRGFGFIRVAESGAMAEAIKTYLATGSINARTLTVNWADNPNGSGPEDDPNATQAYITNFDESLTEDVLAALFSQFGPIVKSHVARDAETNEIKGYAFVGFNTRAELDKAIDAMNDYEFMGQRLSVNVAKGKKEKKKESPAAAPPGFPSPWGYPMPGYGAPMGYPGAPTGAAPGYGAAPSYGAPAGGYAPASGYAPPAPAQQWGSTPAQPSSGYGAQAAQGQYGGAQSGYGQQQQQYGRR